MERAPVVLDTNVFVAAGFRPGSASRALVDAVRRGELSLVWDEATRSETEAVLRRIPPLSWEAAAELFREEHRFAGAPEAASFPEVPDPGDRKFAALACAAGATLVSMDAALLEASAGGRFAAETPGAFLARLGGE